MVVRCLLVVAAVLLSAPLPARAAGKSVFLPENLYLVRAKTVEVRQKEYTSKVSRELKWYNAEGHYQVVEVYLGPRKVLQGKRFSCERYLHALELDQFDQLPPGSYRRAFLRTYAGFLALDADLLVDEYVARYERHKSPHTAVPPPIPVGRQHRRHRRR